MGAIILGPGRAEELDLTIEQIESRSKKLKKLEKPINEMSVYMAEGWTMSEGMPTTGTELAYMYAGAINFAIAALMEKGYLPKRLPTVKVVESDDDNKGYL